MYMPCMCLLCLSGTFCKQAQTKAGVALGMQTSLTAGLASLETALFSDTNSRRISGLLKLINIIL